MTKHQFLISLNERLSERPRQEVEERLRFYSEMIEDRMEDGLSEDEAVAAVGSVEHVAAQIREEIPPVSFPESPVQKKRRGTGEILLLILGAPLWIPLLIAAAAVVFAVYVSWWAVLISLWAVDIALGCCTFGCLVFGAAYCIRGSGAVALAFLSAGLVCAGLTVLLFFGCKALTKGSVLLVANLIKRRGYHG